VSCFAAGLEGIQEHALVFQRAPQTFDEDVVHPAATAVHRDADADVIQCVCEGEAGELAALVGVEDAGPAVASNRLLHRRNTEVSIHRVGEPPSENLAARPVHNGDEVEEAALHRNVGHIRTPHLVRLIDGQVAQQIRIDLVLRVRLAGLRALIDRRQARLGHCQCRFNFPHLCRSKILQAAGNGDQPAV